MFYVLHQIEGKGHSIRRSYENGTKASIFVPPGSQPFDLAIDIIGRLLFWTCSHANTINVTRYVLYCCVYQMFDHRPVAHFKCIYF